MKNDSLIFDPQDKIEKFDPQKILNTLFYSLVLLLRKIRGLEREKPKFCPVLSQIAWKSWYFKSKIIFEKLAELIDERVVQI